jgi:cytosine/adenosine deaminase-related metal-dependent hydrolase
VRAVYRAAWVLPIVGPPVRDGRVAVEDGRIVAVGAAALARRAGAKDESIDLGQVALLPGLVNAHAHLELSWMRGRVPPAPSMPAWARALIAIRREAGGDDGAAVRPAVEEMHRAGTAVVGDVGNSLVASAALAAGPLHALVFLELLGLVAADPERLVAEAVRRSRAVVSNRVRTALAAHAPYSTGPAVFRAIGAASVGPDARAGVHLAESSEEGEFLRTGRGAWRELLEELGAWSDRWEPPACGPAEYLDRLGFLRPGLVAVHGVQLTTGEMRLLAARRVALVTCPRSNQWTGAGSPPVADFFASGLRVAVGTDSLASVDDLNLFAELAELRRLAPAVPASWLLRSATLDGASALGWAREFGSIEPGKRAALIAVALPGGVDDVEEELVGGVTADRIRWVGREVS